MVCTANDLLGWKDFPKGLRVLLLDEDRNSAAEIRSKLEEMDYIVSIFYDEEEALSAISDNSEGYHVAIVEVNTGNSHGRFKFLEAAKDLPTIMTSNKHCLTTMMKCIALGAVEFLLRPLSEDKLRNIWQHVVHKAFNAGGCDLSKSLLPVKESVVSMIQLQLEDIDTESIISEDMEKKNGNDEEQSPGKDKYPAPSTPQLEQGVRSVDETNFSMEKESWENDGESKSVETTCGNSAAELDSSTRTDPPLRSIECVVKEEDESANGSKSESIASDISPNNVSLNGVGGDSENLIKASGQQNSCGTARSNRKKMKVDWTPELHKKFVQAVENLGVDQAIPSRILELMKVEGLTRHNVASHLQKFRMHRRHILPKEDDRRWPHPRDPTQRSYFPHKPVMAYPPPYHHNHTLTLNQVYPPWGPPSSYAAGVQMWGPSSYPPWQPAESWHWKPYPMMNADAWGCPVMPPPHGVCQPFPQNASGFRSGDTLHNIYGMPPNFFDLQPPEDVLDKVVKEAISKPWLPLPLGLKPPSTESVLTELSQQGISTIPPHINGNHLC